MLVMLVTLRIVGTLCYIRISAKPHEYVIFLVIDDRFLAFDSKARYQR
jgi:hypothetical protein